MGRQVIIPKEYRSYVGGESVLNFDVSSQNDAITELSKLGIPAVAARSFNSGSTRKDAVFNGTKLVNQVTGGGVGNPSASSAKNWATGAAKSFMGGLSGKIPGFSYSGGDNALKNKADALTAYYKSLGINQFDVGSGEESAYSGMTAAPTNTFFPEVIDPKVKNLLAQIGKKATSGDADQFVPDALRNGSWSDGLSTKGKTFTVDKATGTADPNLLRTLYPQGEGGDDWSEMLAGDAINISPEEQFRALQFAPDPTRIGSLPDPSMLASLSSGDSLNIEQIISMFGTEEGGSFGNAIMGEAGAEMLNPLLQALLLTADEQNGRVSRQQIADLEARSREQVASFNKDAAIEIARQNGLSDTEVARIASDADTAIATARGEVEKYISDQQLTGVEAQAGATEAAAESAAGATTAAAESMASGQLGAAEAAAGAASPFGFMQQATTNDAQQTPEEQLSAIYDELNAVGLAQAGAANIGAQDNAFSFAAGQARNPVTGELDFDPNQLEQIAANTPAAFAAQGQEAAARAGATGFGALLSGDAAQQANANAILRAQAANNPYAMQQLGQGWAGTGAADQNARIDQILRGGLSAQQRLAEINASQSGQNLANQLNFIGNPSAVGFATQQGLFGGGNNQILQDINNSPEGNVPGSLFGFNSPSSAGAGGGATQNISDTGRNFNANTLRNASDEEIGFIQGAEAARGRTPSEFRQKVESFTPQGY